jgi:hypothetical protein
MPHPKLDGPLGDPKVFRKLPLGHQLELKRDGPACRAAPSLAIRTLTLRAATASAKFRFIGHIPEERQTGRLAAGGATVALPNPA